MELTFVLFVLLSRTAVHFFDCPQARQNGARPPHCNARVPGAAYGGSRPANPCYLVNPAIFEEQSIRARLRTKGQKGQNRRHKNSPATIMQPGVKLFACPRVYSSSLFHCRFILCKLGLHFGNLRFILLLCIGFTSCLYKKVPLYSYILPDYCWLTG